MSRAALVRLAIFAVTALMALAVLWWTRSLGWFAVAGLGVLVAGIPAERLYRRLASPEAQRADLEDRVRNPPS